MTLVRPIHPEKALSPIDVTEVGIVTLESSQHSAKAFFLIDVTELGIVTLYNP